MSTRLHISSSVSPAVGEIIQELESLTNEPPSESWLKRWADALSAFNDHWVSAFWLKSSDSSNPSYEEFFRMLSDTHRPQVERLDQALIRKAVEFPTDDPRLARIIERMRMEALTLSEANLELAAQERALVRKFQQLRSKSLIPLEEAVPPAVAQAQLRREPDRTRREWIWLQLENAKARDYATIDALFFELVKLRNLIASNAGQRNYRDYIWLVKQRLDYTPDDALRWLEQLNDLFADAQERFARYQAQTLQVDTLRPWDMAVTALPKDGASKRTLEENEYIDAITSAYGQLSASFASLIGSMFRKGHADLLARPNKLPNNFATVLATHDEPVVFTNATGDPFDMRVLLHEFGHAIHYAHSGPGKLYFEKGAAFELMEFVAYALQTLASEQLHKLGFLDDTVYHDYQRFITDFVLSTFREETCVERFQHWLYQQPDIPSVTELDDAYLKLDCSPLVDYSGLEAYQKKGWHYDKIIRAPFYSIEYPLAWLGVLVFLNRYRARPQRALEQLQSAMRFGKTRGLRETFAALDIRFPFTTNELIEAREAFEREFLSALA